MKVNLELEKANPIKTFSFSVHNKYEQTVIGKGSTSAKTLVQMPNFVGSDVSKAKEFAATHGLNLVINEVEGTSYQFVGQIVSQSIPEKTDISMLNKSKTVTISVVKEREQYIPNPPVEVDPPTENPEDPEVPGVPGDDNTNNNIETQVEN